MYMPGAPTSSIVGTSGRAGQRVLAMTARAFNLPPYFRAPSETLGGLLGKHPRVAAAGESGAARHGLFWLGCSHGYLQRRTTAPANRWPIEGRHSAIRSSLLPRRGRRPLSISFRRTLAVLAVLGEQNFDQRRQRTPILGSRLLGDPLQFRIHP